MPIDDHEATPGVVPASERWRLFRAMLKEPDDERRQDLVRQYYRSVTRDMLARYRDVDSHRDER